MTYEPPHDFLLTLGLTAYEARTYAALLKHPAAAPAVVAREAGIPAPHVYRVLRRLVESGFAARSSAGRITYRPVDPDQAIARLEAQERERRDRTDRAVAVGKEVLKKIFAEAAREPALEEYIEINKNQARIFARMADRLEAARRQVLAFAKPLGFATTPARGSFAERYALTLRALKRGVEIKALYESPESASPAGEQRLKDLNRLAARGEQIRLVKELPMRMYVFDGREVAITLEDPATTKPTITCLAVTHRALATGLTVFFEKYWAEAKPLARPRGKRKRKTAGAG